MYSRSLEKDILAVNMKILGFLGLSQATQWNMQTLIHDIFHKRALLNCHAPAITKVLLFAFSMLPTFGTTASMLKYSNTMTNRYTQLLQQIY